MKEEDKIIKAYKIFGLEFSTCITLAELQCSSATHILL
jgi:hypothetical protein